MENGYFVGYARRDISPLEPVPLMGYGNTTRRISGPVLDPLYATCVAISDNKGETVLMLGIDATVPNYRGFIQDTVGEALGIAPERIVVNATHTHSAPDQDAKHPGVEPYRELYKKNCVEACLAAFADRKPATLYYGSIETEGLNFVRHYRMDDGSFGGDNFGDWENHHAVANATEVDPTMHLLKFVREAAPDVVVMSWRAHASITGGSRKPDVSADFVGSVRSFLEEQTGCLFAYWQGCAGNVNPRSRIPEQDCTRDYLEFGKLLGGFALRGLENMTQQPAGDIRFEKHTFPGRVNHAQDHLAEKAAEIKAYYAETADWSGAKKMGAPFGIRTPFMAGGIVKRAQYPETWDTTVTGIVLHNDLAIIGACHEMFDTTGQYVEDHSPFKNTISLGYTNGQLGYMPTAYAWYYSCYETDCTRFAAGVAEDIAYEQLCLLRRLKK